jgi:hypothetical protein
MKYLNLVLGWFLVLQYNSGGSWTLPYPYSSFDECKRAATIGLHQYDRSSSRDRMMEYKWNCVPNQRELDNME